MHISVERDRVFDSLPFGPDPSSCVDRWLQLPMGWDTSFVNWLIDRYSPARVELVIDPFCGTGAISSVRPPEVTAQ